jgi:hypothetical protein
MVVAVSLWTVSMLGPPRPAWLGVRDGSCLRTKTTEDTDLALCGLGQGGVEFLLPARLTRGQSSEAVLWLGAVADSVLEQAKLQVFEDRGVLVGLGTMLITPEMGMVLEGSGFDISPLPDEPRRQLISAQRETEWRWHVTPTRSGPQRLALTALLYLRRADGTEGEYRLVLADQTLDVGFGWRKAASDLTGWIAERVPLWLLIAAGLGAISPVVWNRYKKRTPNAVAASGKAGQATADQAAHNSTSGAAEPKSTSEQEKASVPNPDDKDKTDEPPEKLPA